jgi:hypothetical protein
MKLARVLLLSSMATGLIAQTPTWDTSGNGMLNGQYYFRHVTYEISSAGTGALYDALSLYGSVAFDGKGTYSMSATLLDGRSGQIQRGTIAGTYSIAASGHGLMSNPLFSGDSIDPITNETMGGGMILQAEAPEGATGRVTDAERRAAPCAGTLRWPSACRPAVWTLPGLWSGACSTAATWST